MTVHTATGLRAYFMPGAGPTDVAGDFYLSLTGTNLGTSAGSKATTPDHASLDITGDIDVRIDVDAVSWAAPTGTGRKLIGKGNFSAGDRSWLLWLDVNRKLVFRWTTNGTTGIDSVSTAPISITSGRLAVRVTLDVNDGAGNRVTNFYTAPTISGSWTQLGSTITTAGTTSIWNSATALEIGDVIGSTFYSVAGRCYAAEVRNGIAGSVVANPNFAAQTPGTTSFTDGAGRTWSINSPATQAGFTWVDISNKLTGATTWRIGRDHELSPFPPGTADLVLKNDDRLFDPEYTAGTYYGKLNPRTPFKLSSSSSALDLLGSGGSNASTPDHSSFAVTDLDVRVRVAMDDWTPGGFGIWLVSQWGAAGNAGWAFAINATGFPALSWTADGTTGITRTSTAATGFTDGTDHWVRAVLDANNGAAGHDVRFYTSTDGVTWTQLGTTITTAGTTSIFNSTAALAVGDVLPFAGNVRLVDLRAGIDSATSVALPEFFAQRPGTTSFTDRAGRTWTINGSAAIVNDTTTVTDQFYGFAQDGFGQRSRPPARGDCAIHLVDLLGVLNSEELPTSAYDAEVLADNPVAYWKLDETAGTQMADSSGYGRHGFYDNSILGRDPLVADDGHSVEFPHVGDNRGRWSGQGLPVAAPCTLEAWVKTPRDAAALKTIIAAQRDSSLGQLLWFTIQTAAGGSPNGELVIDFWALGTFYKARGHSRIDDDNPHHVVCTIAGNTAADVALYVDGVVQTKTLISGTNPGSWPSLLLWTVGNTEDNGAGDWGLDGEVDEVAIYDYVLDPVRVTTHWGAGFDGLDGETTGARINRVLDLVGVPAVTRDIATGDTLAGPAAYGGQTAGEYLRRVVESEQGYLFIDHRNGGKVKFRGRYARLTETRSTTSQMSFTDQDAVGNLHYERDGLRIDPNGIDGIVNIAKVTWRGGTEVVEDTASKTAYGPQIRTITTEAPTPEAARSAGNWLVSRYAQPRARVRGFRLRPDADKQLWSPSLDLQISDRVTFVRQPQAVGSAVTNLLTIEGATYTVEGSHWSTDIHTSAAVLGDVAIWGTSTWDVTARWG